MELLVPYKTRAKTKSEAIKRGVPVYFTGVACDNGHVSFRYTNSGRCKSCCQEITRRNNKDKGDLDVKRRLDKLTEKPDFEESW